MPSLANIMGSLIPNLIHGDYDYVEVDGNELYDYSNKGDKDHL